MLGCTPEGRFTEQHDIFFGIANSMKELIPAMNAFWPEAKGDIHIDVWRHVTAVGNHTIEIVTKGTADNRRQNLFFINLGGYKKNEFDEFHYKTLAVAESMGQAVKQSKDTAFYNHFGYRGATSHIDDKFGINVDDLLKVDDMLPVEFKTKYDIRITKSETVLPEDVFHIGYLKIDKIDQQ